jgi:hypothetical protein
MTQRITNIDTLSALIDRLISENIKLFFFQKDNLEENIKHQKIVVSEIKQRISELLTDILTTGTYDYISEKRTFKVEDVTETIEELIKCDIIIGENDRANLEEANSENPSIDNFKKNHKLMRKSNEQRAVNKNEIDSIFKEIVRK